MPDDAAPMDFATLDALLDRALSLDEDARTAFLATLPTSQRERVAELLELSDAMTLGSLASSAAAAIETIGRNAGRPMVAGRWRLQRELGSGGMGQVFYATREEHDAPEAEHSGYVQHAAVKVVWSHRADQDVMARFFRERRILAALDHPGLARFLDGGFLTDGRPWFAMEYVDGVDIVEYATRSPLDERLRLFLEICASVAYAHERLIVHRDLKPQNVLVDTEHHTRLLDFGVAALLEESDDGVHTRTRGSPLTLQYASPEQLTGELVSVASDIYQLGLVLYEMLAGRPAHDVTGASLEQAMIEIRERAPAPPGSFNPTVPADLDAIVATALDKAPSARYRSVDALAADIERFLAGHPVHAVGQSRWYVMRRYLRRNALVVGAATTAAVSLTVAAIVSAVLAVEAQNQADRSAASRQILVDVFQKADPFGDGGADVTLADALIRAKPDIAARVADDPLLAWEVNTTLGRIFESLGLAEHEVSAFADAVDAADQLQGAGNERRLLAVAGLGGTLARTNPAEAVAYFEAQFPAAPRDDAEVAPWLNGQYSFVGAQARLREFAAADAGTLRMANVVERFGVTDPRTLGRLNQLLAGVARRAGDTAAEGARWRDAVRHMTRAGNPAALAVTLSNMAIHLGRTGQFDASDEAFRAAIDVYDSAGHSDDSYAGVLRSYAGLQFRMRRVDEAIDTTRRALDLLDPATQAYARFVALNNLAHYTFATGATEQTLAAVVEALADAATRLDAGSGVTNRMLGVFAKLMLFAEHRDLAAAVLDVDPRDCADDAAFHQALDALEDPAEREARDGIWGAIQSLRGSVNDGRQVQHEVDAAVLLYEENVPPFFDVLDRWRVVSAVTAAGQVAAVPERITREYTRLAAARQQARSLIDSEYAAVKPLAARLASRAVPDTFCDTR